jgi:hypothetical protein
VARAPIGGVVGAVARQCRRCRHPGVAGQDKVGELVLNPHADPSLDRPKGIRTWRVNPADRPNAPPVKANPGLARIVVAESGGENAGNCQEGVPNGSAD